MNDSLLCSFTALNKNKIKHPIVQKMLAALKFGKKNFEIVHRLASNGIKVIFVTKKFSTRKKRNSIIMV